MARPLGHTVQRPSGLARLSPPAPPPMRPMAGRGAPRPAPRLPVPRKPAPGGPAVSTTPWDARATRG